MSRLISHPQLRTSVYENLCTWQCLWGTAVWKNMSVIIVHIWAHATYSWLDQLRSSSPSNFLMYAETGVPYLKYSRLIQYSSDAYHPPHGPESLVRHVGHDGHDGIPTVGDLWRLMSYWIGHGWSGRSRLQLHLSLMRCTSRSQIFCDGRISQSVKYSSSAQFRPWCQQILTPTWHLMTN